MTPERRVCLFGMFFLSCLIPFILLYLIHDPLYTLDPSPGPYKEPFYVLLAGVIVYIGRYPERWSKTGRFDYLGASHQIFHVLVLIGIALNLKANVMLYE